MISIPEYLGKNNEHIIKNSLVNIWKYHNTFKITHKSNELQLFWKFIHDLN